MKKEKSFEDKIKRIEEIVSLLENGEKSLDECISLYEEGAHLSAECYKKLSEAEQKITEFSKINVISQEEK